MLAMMLGYGSGTHFGASQSIPMGPCRLTRRLMLGVVMPLNDLTRGIIPYKRSKYRSGYLSNSIFLIVKFEF